MGLKFSVHTEGMDDVRRQLALACDKAEHVLAIQVEADTVPYVPALTGSLTQRTRAIGNTVVYPGPYARYLYYGKLMVDPDTGSPWAKKGATKVLTDRNLVFSQAMPPPMHPNAQAHWCEASKAQNIEKWVRVAQKAVAKYGK